MSKIRSGLVFGGNHLDDINALFNAHGNAVYNFCLHLAKNEHDGDDLFQDVMLRAVQLLSKIDKYNNPKSYLFSIAVNLWKNITQKRARRNRIAPAAAIDEPDDGSFIDYKSNIESEAINRETHEALREIINALDDKYRIPIILFYTDELKISEIASLLKKPEGTIKRLLYEAKGKIKKRMEAKGYG